MKTYISLRALKYSTSILVEDHNGKKVPQSITFQGGFTTPFKRNGVFRTPHKKLQKAIENDPGYGIYFTLLSSDSNVVPPSDPAPSKSAETDSTGGIIEIGDEVQNISDAKAYLMDKFGATPEDVKNKAELLKFASSKVTFKNVK
jgi:hypothetical protein